MTTEEREQRLPEAELPDATTGEITARRTRVAYVTAGAGHPVVLLHGVAENKRWMTPLFGELAKTHRVFSVDLPGHGNSTWANHITGFSDAVDWIDGVLDGLELPVASVAGNSLGGRFALEYTLAHPERVQRAAMVAAPLVIHSLRQLTPLATLINPKIGSYIPLGAIRRRTPLGPRLHARLAKMLYHRPQDADPADVREAVGSIFSWLDDPLARRIYLGWLRRIYLEKPDVFWARLETLDRPALFVWGEHDAIVASGLSQHVVSRVPEVTSLVVPDVGHAVMREARELIVGTVSRFLAGTDAAAAG